MESQSPATPMKTKRDSDDSASVAGTEQFVLHTRSIRLVQNLLGPKVKLVRRDRDGPLRPKSTAEIGEIKFI
ncbi:unnamed protein product [Arabis nemorensis]|uniref:Uncharacterized protein n=1 Tax=Arabis nemorensis TaxID=586526 RepID=A0A565CNB2_9BRAS|nr:unnamed protein product [Arabis nemorensis]